MSVDDQVRPAQTAASPDRRDFAGYPTVEINGLRLAYIEKGSGDAVILVHGSISDLRVWDRQVDVIGDSHRVIAYSGRYAWPNEEIAVGAGDPIQPHVDELLSLITTMNAAPAHLVGNSWGAFICLLAALQRPELVRSMVLEEPPVLTVFVSMPPAPEEMGHLFQTRPAAAAALANLLEKALGPAIGLMQAGQQDEAVQVFARGVIGERDFAELPEQVKEMMLGNGRQFLEQQLRGGFPEFSEADAASIDTPTLLVTGQRSPEAFHQCCDRLRELLPNVEHVEIANASHVMHYQNPAAVNRNVLDFIKRH